MSKINIKVGESVVYIDKYGNESAALVNAVHDNNRVSLHYFPTGNTGGVYATGVTHKRNAAAGSVSWKKP